MLKVKSLLQFIFQPTHALFFLVVAGIIFQSIGQRVISLTASILAISGFIVFGLFPAGDLILAPLEGQHSPPSLDKTPPPYGIIVLGGAVNVTEAEARGTLLEFFDGGERIVTAALLAKRFEGAKVLVSGGAGSEVNPKLRSEASEMRRILGEFGIDASRILVEEVSRTTYENAVYTAKLLGSEKDQNWWLITSAYHMPRAIGAFKTAGFRSVSAFPVDFRSAPDVDIFYTYDSMITGLANADVGIREWSALAYYWLSGRIESIDR